MTSIGHRLASLSSHLSGNSESKMKIVVCRDLGPDVMPLLRSRPELEIVVWPHDRPSERKWLLDNINGATGLVVVFGEAVTPELLEAAGPNLRVVSTMSVGYEHINLAAVAARGIKVGYTPDVLTDAGMFEEPVNIELCETMSLVQSGHWPMHSWSPFGFCGPQLSSDGTTKPRTIGFLGFGRIAQATLARLIPFGVKRVIYTGSPSSPPTHERDQALVKEHKLDSLLRVDIAELAKESDVLFVLAPGGPKTRHIVNEEVLRKMKKTAILVNASRGTLVDSDALAKALREKWIWGAGIDVVEGEPQVGIDHCLVKEPRLLSVGFFGLYQKNDTKNAMAPQSNNDTDSEILSALKAKYEYQSSSPTKSSGSRASTRSSPYAGSPRRSSRIVKKEEHSAVVQELVNEESSEQETAVAGPSKSSRLLKKKRRQGKRGYAPPETYAHLSNLTDCLKFELDVVFCGINPGRLSAQVGHHFANPNNHFWKALAASGFTSKRIPPHEDVTLPDLFNIGLTDLVERPTSGESELSAAEKAESVLSLLSKIAHFRPRIVAFVGLGIAKVVELGVLKLNNSMPSNKGFKLAPGLQDFKLVYADAQEQSVGETLFYAMPSSSGAVSQYQLPDKVKIMEDVRDVLEKVKARTLDTSNKNSITPEQLPDFVPVL
ncbi:hypothetical protein EYR38_000070 [Pleurotus pulmonarius]|nr:hypothetical protein EYR38_000070 [Pleurotus pulmonarius]